jgi:riboflavin synthase
MDLLLHNFTQEKDPVLMFTGIVETVGTIIQISESGTNKTFVVSSSLSNELRIDQSVLHDGICLTVEKVEKEGHFVSAVHETLEKTNLMHRKTGDKINIERSLTLQSLLDGHIVQGHVDATAVCIGRSDLSGSWEYSFKYPAEFSALIIEKGSVCINGVSLTAFALKDNTFKVAIIPYTYHHTNFSSLGEGSVVNIEFDVIGKYAQRIMLVGQTKNHAE